MTTHSRQSVRRALGAALVAMVACALGSCAQPPADPCAPAGELNFVCGLAAPEDLVHIPDSRWLIASGMQTGSGLHLIDQQAKRAQPLATIGGGVQERYIGCPGPMETPKAILHGLSLRPASTGFYTLYATHHGGRESVEVFELDTRGTVPSATWIGCVLVPDGLAANSVAAFGDGTLVATVVTTPGKTFEDLFAGRPTGVVLQWTPGSPAFTPLPGTELAGNNGIDTSPDDTEFYVAASGGKQVVAFARADPSKPLRVAHLSGYAPDNVRLENGTLVTTGMLDDEPSCGGAPKSPEGIQCARGYVVSAIDPRSMAVTEIARGPAAAPYKGTATAVRVGRELWLSSFNADRVAYRALGQP
jgi:hypothetical protein